MLMIFLLTLTVSAPRAVPAVDHTGEPAVTTTYATSAMDEIFSARTFRSPSARTPNIAILR